MKPNNYILYDCAQLSVEHLIDCAQNLAVAEANSIRLLLAAKAAHAALVSALTAALTQSNFSGALTPKAARNFKPTPLQEYQTTDKKADHYLDLSVADLRDDNGLLSKAKDAGLDLKLTSENVRRLLEIRDQIEHPKPMGIYAVTVDYVVEPVGVTATATANLIADLRRNVLGDDKRLLAKVAAGDINAHCRRLMGEPSTER